MEWRWESGDEDFDQILKKTGATREGRRPLSSDRGRNEIKLVNTSQDVAMAYLA